MPQETFGAIVCRKRARRVSINEYVTHPARKSRKAGEYSGAGRKARKPLRKNESSGGETGIRTLGTVNRTLDFESSPFDHSGISPPTNLSKTGARGKLVVGRKSR